MTLKYCTWYSYSNLCLYHCTGQPAISSYAYLLGGWFNSNYFHIIAET